MFCKNDIFLDRKGKFVFQVGQTTKIGERRGGLSEKKKNKEKRTSQGGLSKQKRGLKREGCNLPRTF